MDAKGMEMSSSGITESVPNSPQHSQQPDLARDADAASPAEKGPMTLCASGDVILTARMWNVSDTQAFPVSSEILSLASPVFRTLFHGKMAEAEQLRDQQKLRLTLEDDDGVSLEIIFRVLHHDPSTSTRITDMDLLARVAVHCDKYDCSGTLRPWIASWLEALKPIAKTPVELGLHMLIHYKLRSVDGFRAAFVDALQNLKPNFSAEWDEHHLLCSMPGSISTELRDQIEACKKEIRELIETIDLQLKSEAHLYEMSFQECVTCGRTHPQNAMQCRPCGTKDLRQRYCNSETRTVGYIAVLRQVELWGACSQPETSVAEMTSRLDFAKDDVKHVCKAGTNCPLKAQIRGLILSVGRLVAHIKGPDVESFAKC